MKKLNYVVLLLLLAVGITAAQSGGTPPRQSINPQTGKVRFIGASVSNPIIVAGAIAPGLSNDARANAILSVYAPQFGVNVQDLSLMREIIVDANRISRRYQQYYQGVPVVGGQIIVNMTPAGGLVSMIGDVSPDLAVSTVATVSGAQAQQIALQHVGKQFGVNTATISASAPALGIYDEQMLTVSSKSPALVWDMEVVSTIGAPIRAKVLVDAQTGWVVLSFNRIHTHEELNPGKSLGQVNVEQARLQNQAGVGVRVPGTADLATYTANNGTSLPGTFLCDETDLTCTDGADSDADSAHTHANGTYDIYWDWHGRDSLDDAGMLLISTVHVAAGWCNASWNGIQMQYGDGCGNSIVVDDVVSHELTHGVTEFSSGLFYSYESGAINESFSDVWGEFYDLTNGTPEDIPANRWIVGEEVFTGGLRNMQNPPANGDPDRTQSPLFYKGNADSGGVHTNSGVNNKAAYLMVDGDTFNGFTITGIGFEKTAAVYYDSQTTKLTPTSSYVQLGEALNQSCTELIGGPEGITAADCEQVMNATLATEMQIEPSYPPAAVADVCETGTAVTLFSDDFESGAANWTTSVDQGSDAWTINDTDGPLNGSFNLRGRESDVPTLSYAAMVNDVVLPSGSYLHFVHKFTFEPTYDGGIVQYSTNGGASWSQVTSVPFYEEGINYVTNLDAGNPLGVIPAFTGLAGNGVGSTRYTLASLDGQSVRFRFALGTDLGTGGVGWRIDDVQIYTCDAGAETPTATPDEPTPTPTATELPGAELIGNGGFENLGGDGKPDVTPWEVKNSSGDKAKCNKDKDGDGIPDKIVANTGECAFLFKNVVGDAGKIQQTLDLSSVIPAVGDGLNLSFVADSSGGATVKFKVVVKYADDTKTKISLESDGTETYTEFVGSETLTSADIAKAKVNAKSSATSGKVYVDDVSLLYVVNSGGARLIPMPQSNNLGTR